MSDIKTPRTDEENAKCGLHGENRELHGNFAARLNLMIDFARQLERELIAAAQWQPIETAPRDGTRVLVWCGDAAYICFWFQPPPETELKIGWTFKVGSLFCYMQQESVSHWTPLPPPPSEMFAPETPEYELLNHHNL